VQPSRLVTYATDFCLLCCGIIVLTSENSIFRAIQTVEEKKQRPLSAKSRTPCYAAREYRRLGQWDSRWWLSSFLFPPFSESYQRLHSTYNLHWRREIAMLTLISSASLFHVSHSASNVPIPIVIQPAVIWKLGCVPYVTRFAISPPSPRLMPLT